jgi:hypothetical protein
MKKNKESAERLNKLLHSSYYFRRRSANLAIMQTNTGAFCQSFMDRRTHSVL